MPNRIVREGILTSDRVNKLSWAGENYFRRLMSVVDDYGRFDGRPGIIRISAFPLKVNQVSESDIVKWSDECSAAGLIRFYEVDKKKYMELLDFDQRLRIKKSKYPAPTDVSHMSDTRQPVVEVNPKVEVESESEGEVEKRAPDFKNFDTGNPSFNPPSQAMCEDFFAQCGKTKEAGAKFFFHYNSTDWKDGAGNQITKWADKAQKWILNEKNYHNGTTANRRDGRREPAPAGTKFGQL